MKRFTTTLLIFAATLTVVFAQRGPEGRRGPRSMAPNLEQLQEQLGLSDQQATDLKTLFDETKAQLQSLREQSYDSDEARREAARAILEEQKSAMESILTEEQLETLRSQRSEVRDQKGKRTREPRQNDELRAAVEAYRAENMDPVLRAQRAKLEDVISESDKELIHELRAQRPEEGKRPHRGERPTEEQKAERKANMEQVKGLLETYGTDIKDLMAEIEPQTEQWKEDMKAIHEQYKPEDTAAGNRHRRRGHKPEGERPEKAEEAFGLMRAAHFLLMDPAAQPAQIQKAEIVVKTYPNPAINSTRISYELPAAGAARIELLDKAGNVERVLFSGQQTSGPHELDVDLSQLQTGVYYYRITDAQGNQVTEKLVVTK
jgi:hypothetical protein